MKIYPELVYVIYFIQQHSSSSSFNTGNWRSHRKIHFRNSINIIITTILLCWRVPTSNNLLLVVYYYNYYLYHYFTNIFICRGLSMLIHYYLLIYFVLVPLNYWYQFLIVIFIIIIATITVLSTCFDLTTIVATSNDCCYWIIEIQCVTF